jgi:hypothetical protein
VSGKPRFRGVDDFNDEFKNALLPTFARYGASVFSSSVYISNLTEFLHES